MAALWYIVGSLMLTSQASASDSPVVTTTLGKVQGITLSIADHETKAYGFFNIPYAAPPVGELRFQPPQPAAPWDGVKDAANPGPGCPQPVEFVRKALEQMLKVEITNDVPYSEDCLHLSVYTPGLSGRRPVMVFIHGGGLWAGSAKSHDMRVHAIREDIVGVVIQYRLGALGWLSTGDSAIKGNMGFQDQVAALQWVQNNIHKFGGDSNQVTIFGESAGSWSVSMHVLSPLSKGLFHHAIMQSGSVQDLYFFSPPVDVKAVSNRLAKFLECPNDSEELKRCLQSKPVKDFLEPEGHFKFDMTDLIYVPRVDGYCFPDHPSVLLAERNFNSDVDIIVGVTEVEGFGIGNFLYPGFADGDFEVIHFTKAASKMMKTVYPDSPGHWEALGEAALGICEEPSVNGALKKCFAEFAGDYLITSSSYKTVQSLAGLSKGRIFFYEFKHRRESSNKPEYIIADHGDDLFFTFGSSYTNSVMGGTVPNFNTDDKVVEGLILKYWSAFAKTGDPNGEGLPKWPELKENNSYLVISTNPSIEQNYKPNRMKYWTDTAPGIVKAKAHGHNEF